MDTTRRTTQFFTDWELLQLWRDDGGLYDQITKSRAARVKYGRSFTLRDAEVLAAKHIPDNKNLLQASMLYNLSTYYNDVKKGKRSKNENMPGKIRERMIQLLYLFTINNSTYIPGIDKWLKDWKEGKYKALLVEAEYFSEDIIDFEPVDRKTSERLDEMLTILKENKNQIAFIAEQERERAHYQQALAILLDEVEEIIKDTEEVELKPRLMTAIHKFRHEIHK